MNNTVKYWNTRAIHEGKTYGVNPSLSARLAMPFFKHARNKTILEIGGGYGRNSLFFAKNNFKITNIDICEKWINQAKHDKLINNICGDIRNVRLASKFDGAFSNFVLHFFPLSDLTAIFKKIHAHLNENGLFINSWLSKNDTYSHSDSLNGKTYMHCFARDELKKLHHQANFKLEVITELKELEYINKKTRITIFWFTVAKKV